MNELVEVLNIEIEFYRSLTAIAKEKTPVIIEGNINQLQQITEKEQPIVEKLRKMEKRRMQIMEDAAEVLGQEKDKLKLADLVRLFTSQQDEQKKLAAVYDELMRTLKDMDAVNKRNQMLLEQALEMVEFDIQLYQNLKRAPENANYGKDAYSVADKRSGSASFDAKQ
jgi:flagellar biosynthesis/type III secretory pathway chaperone